MRSDCSRPSGRGATRFYTLIDGDVFSVSNLNRQLFATGTSLGKNKVLTAKERLLDINLAVSVRAVPVILTASNTRELFAGNDLVMDCLDSRETRLLLDDACQKLGIP